MPIPVNVSLIVITRVILAGSTIAGRSGPAVHILEIAFQAVRAQGVASDLVLQDFQVM